jgi:hypothetical protein
MSSAGRLSHQLSARGRKEQWMLTTVLLLQLRRLKHFALFLKVIYVLVLRGY